MPLLTVRLTDEDYAALKELAGGSSMAELVRAWIAGQGFDDSALVDEVRRLKKELAGRPKMVPVGSYEQERRAATLDAFAMGDDGPETVKRPGRFGTARPAPKPGAKKQ